MKEEIQRLTLIDRYLRGDLEEDEKEAFDIRYRSDPEFAREMDLQREIKTVLGDEVMRGLHREVKTLVEEARTTTEFRTQRRRWRMPNSWLLAAAITLFFAAAYWLFRNNTSPVDIPVAETPSPSVPEKENPGSPATGPSRSMPKPPPIPLDYRAFALTYYKSPAFPSPYTRNGDSLNLNVLRLAYAEYNEARQNPNSASGHLQRVVGLLASPPDSISRTAHYLRAHARFQLGDYVAAARDFEFVYQEENTNSTDARWFMALSLLAAGGEGRASAALDLLDGLATGSPNARQTEAQQLRLKIRSR